MNIEELKLVIELVKSLSGDATSALIWWMVFDLVKVALVCSFLLAVVWMIAKIISTTSDWAEAGRHVSRAYGGNGGNSYYGSERAAIHMAIKKAGEQP